MKLPTRVAATVLAGMLVAGACAHAPKNPEDQGPAIRDVAFEGAGALAASDLKEKILTQESSWIPFSKKKHFDPQVLQTDLKRVERYYRARGYYQAKVTDVQVTPEPDGQVSLRITVQEGGPTRVTQARLAGLDDLPEDHRKQLEKLLTLEQGEVFEEAEWEGLKARLRTELEELGYVQATIEGQAEVDLARQGAQILLTLRPGARYRFGAIEVKGPQSALLQPWRVEEQVAEAIEEEEWYSETARAEAQARVSGMGVFGAVRVSPGVPDPQTQRVPLVVEVQPSAARELKAGFGIGVEQARNDAHLIGGLTHRNFLGNRLRRLELSARAGYALLPNAYTVVSGSDRLTKSGAVGRLTAELTQPRFFHPNFAGTLETSVERALEPAYSFFGGAAKAGLIWKPWTWLSVTPSYNLELYRLESGAAQLGGAAPALLFGCPQNCVLSYVEQRFEVDKRDHKQEPREGYLLALSLQEGGGLLGGNFRYLRLIPEVRGYFSVLEEKRLTFSGKLRLGTLLGPAGEPTPIVARFFSGGSQMRGFSTRRLSPMRLVAKSRQDGEFSAEALPVGGNGLFEAQLETRYRFKPNVIGALFTDYGLVTSEQVSLRGAYFRENLLMAVGTGVRYLTPVGPLRLDLAYRPNLGPPLAVLGDPTGELTYAQSQGCFGFGKGNPAFGGAPEGPCAIHLSIGEAF